MSLYPLRFAPIYQYRLWGGRRLANLVSAPLPGDGPIGEAWLLSDRDDHQSVVPDGPLKGRSIGQLLHEWPEQLLGKLAGRFHKFPVLMKFLDVRDTLSVQVHPSDQQAKYNRIGVARLNLPEHLPQGAAADSPEATRNTLVLENSRP
jgi:mannose-6-phosphate isomerase